MRQGDPLCPLLFVLTADLLQSIVNEAAARKLLLHPIAENFPGDFPIIRYADDTLIVMQGDARQLIVLKSLLRTFADSTGLHANYDKSFLVPINMEQSKAEHLAQT